MCFDRRNDAQVTHELLLGVASDIDPSTPGTSGLPVIEAKAPLKV